MKKKEHMLILSSLIISFSPYCQWLWYSRTFEVSGLDWYVLILTDSHTVESIVNETYSNKELTIHSSSKLTILYTVFLYQTGVFQWRSSLIKFFLICYVVYFVFSLQNLLSLTWTKARKWLEVTFSYWALVCLFWLKVHGSLSCLKLLKVFRWELHHGRVWTGTKCSNYSLMS